MNTLALSPEWDLYADSSGNIAMLTGISAILQDVATAVRLFLAELWYDTTQGVPYFYKILGEAPPVSLMKAAFNGAALQVPGVLTSKCFLSALIDRVLTGQVQITNSASKVSAVSFAR